MYCLLIQYLEWKWGVYYAEGGTRSIVNSLERLLVEIGVECHKNTEVTQVTILTRETFPYNCERSKSFNYIINERLKTT